ncbi:sphingosine kinase 1-like [Clarias magur]|uniref:Sphingosine kinase 1-like n=1 Tax=Clarias magur TaxID=1594786 RepID=A0A8J4U6P5_CLAMG|nr:sphingosine kinase 1-like [Clarias magur]
MSGVDPPTCPPVQVMAGDGGAELRAEFSDAATGRLRFSVTLTHSRLSVRTLAGGGSPVWQHGQELALGDCVGCRACRSEDEADAAAYLSLYLYPVRRGWTGAPSGRQRVEHRFRVLTGGDARANLEEAERWARAVRHRAAQHRQALRDGVEFSRLCVRRSVMVLVNPQSGRGQAMSLYTGPVLSMLTEANISHTLITTGLVCPLDIVSVRLSTGPRLFSFLSLAWGFVADVDIESEKFRQVGAMRFLVGTLLRLASLRTYQGKLAFLPARENSDMASISSSPGSHPHSTFCSSIQCLPQVLQKKRNPHECISNNPRPNSKDDDFLLAENEPKDDKLPDNFLSPIGDPVPTDWTIEKEQEFVLVLATCHSHLAEELMVSPDAHPDDGSLHLLYVTAGISRPALLRLFLAMEKGTHLTCDCPYLVYRRVRALRLEPITKPGVITVDGEQVEYGPIQAQVHKGYGRIICG